MYWFAGYWDNATVSMLLLLLLQFAFNYLRWGANPKDDEPLTCPVVLRWKWTFCHLLSRLCHTRVSSDWCVWDWLSLCSITKLKEERKRHKNRRRYSEVDPLIVTYFYWRIKIQSRTRLFLARTYTNKNQKKKSRARMKFTWWHNPNHQNKMNEKKKIAKERKEKKKKMRN